jgi:hypothetical protein
MTTAGWVAVAAIGGVALGAAGMSAMRPLRAPLATPQTATAPAARAATCPIHDDANGVPTIDDQKEADRLRQALRDGIFAPWAERGRAPTPAEFAQRMKLPQPDADRLLDQLQACGETVGGGILRAPQSELIAVAWPFANLPTGITVTATGGKPAFARCAIDALGVSEMLQKRTVVEAEARDNGVPIRIVVDVDKVIAADPPGVVVVKGHGCDDMSFFSSREAAETWRAAHDHDATLFTLADAVRRGAKIFNHETAGL